MTNETAEIPYLGKALAINDALLGLPALPLVFVGCLVFGYALKAIPSYSNRWIPAGVFAFGIVLNILITPLATKAEVARALILGLTAGGGSWVAHRKVLSRWINEKDFTPDTESVAKPKDAGE